MESKNCIYCQEPGRIICPGCISNYKIILKILENLGIPISVEDHNACAVIKTFEKFKRGKKDEIYT